MSRNAFSMERVSGDCYGATEDTSKLAATNAELMVNSRTEMYIVPKCSDILRMNSRLVPILVFRRHLPLFCLDEAIRIKLIYYRFVNIKLRKLVDIRLRLIKSDLCSTSNRVTLSP